MLHLLLMLVLLQLLEFLKRIILANYDSQFVTMRKPPKITNQLS